MKKKNVILLIAFFGIAVQAFLLTACISFPPDFPPEAKDAFNRGLKAHTQAWRFEKEDDINKAIAEFTEVIRLYPNFDYAYNLRGEMYMLKGDYDSAIADFEATLRLDPNYEIASNNLAWAKRQKGQSPSTPTQTTPAQATPARTAPTQATPVQPVELGPPTIVQGNNLTEKMDWLKAFAQNNGNYIVEIRANENINNGLWELSFSGKNGITITIRGIGANRTITSNISVGSGNTLILDNNITLRGKVSLDTCTFIMNNGSAISGGVVSSSWGEGTFTMNGGTITGNSRYEVGVSVRTFTMNGGTISGNRYGVYWNAEGTFTMNGGTISGNDFGVSVGTFTMNGGTISGNSWGVYEGGNFTMKDGTISGNGGGVYVSMDMTFIMNGGTISGNTSQGVNVSGAPIRRGTFTMNGGTISGNTASENGGGVYVDGGIFTMNNGTISGNTAKKSGGGVAMQNGTFTISNGTISRNTAIESGGGVWVGFGTFTKTGGTIYGYSANDTVNSNVVKNASGAVQNFRGHAVYAGETSRLLKIREGTAGPGDNMSYDGTKKPPTASGAWDN